MTCTHEFIALLNTVLIICFIPSVVITESTFVAESTTVVAPSVTPVTGEKTVRPPETVSSTAAAASRRMNIVSQFVSDLYLCT